MADLQFIRCGACGMDSGKYHNALLQLKDHINMNPKDADLWHMALNEFGMCYMCNTHITTYYSEFGAHRVRSNTSIPQKMATNLHQAQMNPKVRLVGVVNSIINPK